MPDTSLSLLARVRNLDDRAAWERLAELYTPLFKQWCARFDLQPADADDLVQEVLTTVARELPQFEHNQRAGAFRAWLKAILIHRVRRFWQKRTVAGAGGSSALERLNELADESTGLSRLWEQEHDRYVMASLLSSIEARFLPKTWEAFHRQVFGGERADQVAAALAMPVSSVYVARNRVLSALRQEAAQLLDPS